MNNSAQSGESRISAWDIDPRHSLAAGAMWLIVALAITFSVAAAVVVGRIARENVFEQHIRRLTLETDQLSSDFSEAMAARLGAVRVTQAILRNPTLDGPGSGLGNVFDELVSAYPDLEWITIADAQGVIVSTNEAFPRGSRVESAAWFKAGLRGPWLGMISDTGRSADNLKQVSTSNFAMLGDMSAPIKDKTGQVVGVIAAHLSWRRAPNHPLRLTDESDPQGVTQAYVLDQEGLVLIGPEGLRGKRWNGAAFDDGNAPALGYFKNNNSLHFERLMDGHEALVARAPVSAAGQISSLGWQVQLCEPRERVYQRANALALRILWVSLLLGAATALLGTIGTRHLTRRLKRLTYSVASVGRNDTDRIEVPQGRDEVAQLAQAFAKILDDLQQERRELKTLSSELERRVAVRTSEVERFAEESRYAAIVRERLKIARDLHDTLAHSMMAMLSEIRFLRKLQAHDPAAIPEELAHAEELAHEGLKEARTAITQMRVDAVRELGLGPALSNAFERFIDHTGLSGEFAAETAAARFGDERAEILLSMAKEGLRNIEKHARATRADVTLKIVQDTYLELCIKDNGIGFDPKALHPGHYGIVGLREQAEIIGAELRIDSKPNDGTKLSVLIRLSPMAFGQSP